MVRDRGALEPVFLLTCFSLTALTALLISVWSLAVRLEAAQSGADAAALAAGAADCSVARTVAARNLVRLDSCRLGVADVWVRVSVPVHTPRLLHAAGVPDRLPAAAHASRAVDPDPRPTL